MRSDVPLAGRIFREMTLDIFKHNALVKGGYKVGERVVDLSRITCPLLNVVADYDDVVPPRASLSVCEFVGSADKSNLGFPTGHIGAVVSAGAIGKLWPRIGEWMAERDR